MLSDEVIEKVVARVVNRIEQGNTYVLEQIGKSIKKIGTLSPSNAQQLVQILRYGGDYDKIIKKLQEITNLNTRDIYKIFEEVAKNDYMFAKQFYDYREVKFIPWEENLQLQKEINALANITAKKYLNLSGTGAIGFTVKQLDSNGKLKTVFKDISQTYIDTMDTAVFNVSQGKTTFNEEMSRIMKELGESGLKTINYQNGRSMRLDSAVEMNLKEGLRTLHNEEQQIFGEEFDADGVEVTVHEYPAPDHELVQGRQFTLEEFDKFQNDQDAISVDGIEFPAIADETGHDRRSIAQYNCYHTIFPIIVGVSKPRYTNEQLQTIIKRNDTGFDFDGKHYSMYEGTQLQRKLETEIRKNKDIQIMARASGMEELAQKSQTKINQLTQKYKELSQTSGLKTELERAKVAGYRKIKVK
jgi:hypothetical protein